MKEKQKKDIVFVMPEGTLPVPAIKGGAIETLLTHLIEANENHDDFLFHIIMLKDFKDKIIVEKQYKNTKFYNYYMNMKKLGSNPFMFKALRELRLMFNIACSYDKFILKTIKEIDPNLVIYEGRYNASIKSVKNFLGKEKLAYHIHHCIIKKNDISKNFSKALCVSNFIKEDWIKSNKLTNSIDLPVLPNIINQSQFKKISDNNINDNLKKSLGFSDNDFVVLYVGRLVKIKGIEELITAVKSIQNKNIKLLIVGDSVFKDSKKTKFTKKLCKLCNGWQDKIKFTGFVDNKELYKYYNIANLHVIPSICEEAAGLVALESKAIGVPQLVSNSGGLLEYASENAVVVNKNSDNYIQELSNAIIDIYNNKSLTNKEEKLLSIEDYYNIFKQIIEEKTI